MKVYAVIYQADEVPCWCEVFQTKEQADAHVYEIVKSLWPQNMSGPVPTDPEQAYDELMEEIDDTYIYVEECDVRSGLAPAELYP